MNTKVSYNWFYLLSSNVCTKSKNMWLDATCCFWNIKQWSWQKKKQITLKKTVKCLGWQRWTSSLLSYFVRQQLNPPDFKCFREPGRLLPLRKSNIWVSRCHSWSRPAVTLVLETLDINKPGSTFLKLDQYYTIDIVTGRNHTARNDHR